MNFWDRYRAPFLEKTIAQKHIQIDAMLRSGLSPENALGDGPAFWIFSGFTDNGIRVKFLRAIFNKKNP